jgi:cobalt-zinc-cadmium resistance protein CzcA
MRGLPQYIGCWFYCALWYCGFQRNRIIEHFKELKHQGMKNIDELILKGTTDRLRLFLTAAAALRIFTNGNNIFSAGAEAATFGDSRN